MKKFTEAARFAAAIMMGISAGFSLATSVRAYIRQVVAEERDGVKVEDFFKATTRKKAE